jgi:two-component system KDP operon response regulator KdpE
LFDPYHLRAYELRATNFFCMTLTALPTALVVDDELQVRRAVRHALASDFSRVIESGLGKEALDLAAAQQPELIVLDLGLPDMSGADVCTELRHLSAAPIVVLAARHTDTEKVALLDAGADDYIAKPFAPEDLQARVRAVMQRSHRVAENSCVKFGDFAMDFGARTLCHGDEMIHLTPTEWSLLSVLVRHAGKVLTHHQLFADIWGGGHRGDAQQYLRVHIANLRRKIESNSLAPRFVLTEPGIGYRFDPAG